MGVSNGGGLQHADAETRRRVASAGAKATNKKHPRDAKQARAAHHGIAAIRSLGSRIALKVNEDILNKARDEMSADIVGVVRMIRDTALDTTLPPDDRLKAGQMFLVWMCGVPKQRVEVQARLDIGLDQVGKAQAELVHAQEANREFVDDIVGARRALEPVQPERARPAQLPG